MTDWPAAWLLAGLAKDAHEFQNPRDLHQAKKVHNLTARLLFIQGMGQA